MIALSEGEQFACSNAKTSKIYMFSKLAGPFRKGKHYLTSEQEGHYSRTPTNQPTIAKGNPNLACFLYCIG